MPGQYSNILKNVGISTNGRWDLGLGKGAGVMAVWWFVWWWGKNWRRGKFLKVEQLAKRELTRWHCYGECAVV
jgi:hypothetical protein